MKRSYKSRANIKTDCFFFLPFIHSEEIKIIKRRPVFYCCARETDTMAIKPKKSNRRRSPGVLMKVRSAFFYCCL